MNFAQLSARLDPSYNLKMQHLQAKFQGDIALADYRGQQQAQLEYDKQQNARQAEQDRRNFEIGKERQRLETSREIESDRHRYQLEMLDAELSQHMKKMDGDRN